ncbi:hypothetical protein ILYODFUR_008760 [Ilyodon furcidens]|uniref:Uncharacterized protein n=1 Tax=Ilyodon furcidens TaxID=33524 RepID=A0ABV0V2K0_9TELE
MDVVHSLTLPIHTLYSQVQVPIPHRDNQPPDPGGGHLPSGGGDGLTAPAPEPGLGVPDPERPQRRTPTTPILIRAGGHVQKRGLHGPNKPTNQSRHRIQ